jgi:hypothetical protein
MKVTNEIRIHLVNGKDTVVGDEEVLFVSSSRDRRRGVELRTAQSDRVITVDGDELEAAIRNATNLG